MANQYTSTYLLASLKRRGFIPTSDNFTADDFFKIVDDEMQTYIVPLLMSVREEYLVVTDDIVVGDSNEDGEYGGDEPFDTTFTEHYIPERAIGGKLRDVSYSVGDGHFRQLIRLEPSAVYSYTDSSSSITGAPQAYYLRGNKLVLLGTPSPTDILRVSYYQRPSRVVSTSDVILHESSSTVGNTIRYQGTATFPSDFGSGNITVDIVKGTPGFDIIARNYAGTATSPYVALNFVTYPLILTDLISIGDYICLAGESPIPQIPVELHPLLAQRVTATVLHALGDQKAENAYGVADKMEARVLKLITPRAEGTSRVIQNKYGVGRGRRGY